MIATCEAINKRAKQLDDGDYLFIYLFKKDGGGRGGSQWAKAMGPRAQTESVSLDGHENAHVVEPVPDKIHFV